jgi:hypothetical protein
VKVKGRWQVRVFGPGGAARFTVSLPRSLRGRPQVSVVDLDGDGGDDLLIKFRVGKKWRRMAFSGATGAPLPA